MRSFPFLCLSVVALAIVSCGEKKNAASSPGETEPDSGPQGYVLYDVDFTPKVGRIYSDQVHMEMKGGKVTVTAGGREMEGTLNTVETYESTIESLEGGAKRETKTSQSGSNQMVIAGNPAPDEWQASPLLNHAVILTKKDGTWSGRLEQGSPTAEQQEEIDSLVKSENQNGDKRMYGTEARQIGDTWTADLTGLDFLGEMKNGAGEATLTLDKVEEYQGQQCAFLTAKMKIAGEHPDLDEGMEGQMSFTADLQIIRSLDQQVDLKGDLEGQMEMLIQFPGGETKIVSPMTMQASGAVQ